MLSRLLKVDVDDTVHDLPISISDPARGEAGGWFCDYTIGWPDRPRAYQGWGIDPIQAFWLTLQMIGTELYTSDAHAQQRLTWIERGDGYGFPVPVNLRGDLIGSDRRFL